MDANDFDARVRSWGSGSRRAGLGLLVSGGLAALAFRLDGGSAEGKKKGKKKRCKGNKKKCGKGCIPKTSCCGDGDCGPGGACVDRACACLAGFKPCQEACIPDADCCTAADCAHLNDSCKRGICESNGQCVAENLPDGAACIDIDTNCIPQHNCSCVQGICSE